MAADAPLRRRLDSAAATRTLGADLAATRPQGEDAPALVYLSGELGAGKTTLAAALLAALGVREPVRSPSYALIEIYDIPNGHAVHLDCYRLGDAQELELLGLRAYDVPHALWLVEWPEKAAGVLPVPDLWITLKVIDEGRMAECRPESMVGTEWLQRLLRMPSYVANNT